jgi:preprotein translocase subunit SecG
VDVPYYFEFKTCSAFKKGFFREYFFAGKCISLSLKLTTLLARPFVLCSSRPIKFSRNCITTNVMHKFLIYLSIYFCLTCFGLSFSPSSEAGVQLRQWFKSAGYGGIVHYVCHYTISYQNAQSLQHKIKFSRLSKCEQQYLAFKVHPNF